MTPRLRMIRLAAAGFAGAVVVLLCANFVYFSPRAATLEEMDQTRGAILSLESRLEDQLDVRRRRKELGKTLLAKDQDLVEHRFRTALSTIAERAGLTKVEVSHFQPKPIVNPVANAAKVTQSSLKKALRTSPDFSVIQGQMKGQGTLGQVLQTVAVVQTQPWIHRFEGFTLKPLKDRDHFEIRMDVSTILAPSIRAENGEDAEILPAPTGSESLWQSMLAKNVFKSPPADQPPQPPVQLAAAGVPAVGMPYEEYRLTGVVRSSQGVVAFLLNTRTSERVTLLAGGKVLDAVLVDGQGERAVFDIAGKRFEIFNGNTLAARRQLPEPVNSAAQAPVAAGGA